MPRARAARLLLALPHPVDPTLHPTPTSVHVGFGVGRQLGVLWRVPGVRAAECKDRIVTFSAADRAELLCAAPRVHLPQYVCSGMHFFPFQYER